MLKDFQFYIDSFYFLQPRIVDWKTQNLYSIVFNKKNEIDLSELPDEVQELAPEA